VVMTVVKARVEVARSGRVVVVGVGVLVADVGGAEVGRSGVVVAWVLEGVSSAGVDSGVDDGGGGLGEFVGGAVVREEVGGAEGVLLGCVDDSVGVGSGSGVELPVPEA
jgi:hypothetical protein